MKTAKQNKGCPQDPSTAVQEESVEENSRLLSPQ